MTWCAPHGGRDTDITGKVSRGGRPSIFVTSGTFSTVFEDSHIILTLTKIIFKKKEFGGISVQATSGVA